MAIRNLMELRSVLPPPARLIGLDLGDKTIGMAACDPGWQVASPIGTVRRTKFTADVQELARAMRDRDVRGLVVGLPVNMDGTHGPRCDSVKEFCRLLLQRTNLFGFEPEIAFWDERLSTSAVDRMMIGWDMTRKRRDEVVDKMAAARRGWVHPDDADDDADDDAPNAPAGGER